MAFFSDVGGRAGTPVLASLSLMFHLKRQNKSEKFGIKMQERLEARPQMDCQESSQQGRDDARHISENDQIATLILMLTEVTSKLLKPLVEGKL